MPYEPVFLYGGTPCRGAGQSVSVHMSQLMLRVKRLPAAADEHIAYCPLLPRSYGPPLIDQRLGYLTAPVQHQGLLAECISPAQLVHRHSIRCTQEARAVLRSDQHLIRTMVGAPLCDLAASLRVKAIVTNRASPTLRGHGVAGEIRLSALESCPLGDACDLARSLTEMNYEWFWTVGPSTSGARASRRWRFSTAVGAVVPAPKARPAATSPPGRACVLVARLTCRVASDSSTVSERAAVSGRKKIGEKSSISLGRLGDGLKAQHHPRAVTAAAGVGESFWFEARYLLWAGSSWVLRWR